MAEKVDVLICGSGSAGICAATWLAQYGIKCKILEQMAGPLQKGQADGVQCRTVEIFETFGKSEELLREAYHCMEVCFWKADGAGGIARTSRTPDTPLGISHMPHLILNQARINGMLLEHMRDSNDQGVEYGYTVEDVQVDGSQSHDHTAYPVTVVATKDGRRETFQAKYLFGSDGAHSVVRRSLGYKMVGESTNKVWGVMDVFPRTDFPDIRKKVTIHSDRGNILIIPREGPTMVRFYIELPPGKAAKEVKLEDLFAAVKRIFHPYAIDIVDTWWWSAYAIGQRLADHFTKDYRVFLAGDACHTHSPKAGQGMNCSLQDGYNFGWKMASILKGIASPDLLKTYVLERQKTAKELIDFDRYWTQLWSKHEGQDDGEDFTEAFKKAGKYMAGVGVQYPDSEITNAKSSRQDLAKNLVVGMRMPSVEAVRMSDAKVMQLARSMPSDGRWRLLIFAGDVTKEESKVRFDKLGDYLESPDGPVARHTPRRTDVDSFIEPIVVLSGRRTEIDHADIHDYFWPTAGKMQIRDLHKIFFDDETPSGYGTVATHVHEFYGVSPDTGAVVIIRPDHYVSMVVGLEDHAAIADFFHGFALARGVPRESRL